jgi:hypothetical protein
MRAPVALRRARAAPAGCLAPADERQAASWLGSLELGAGRAAAAVALYDRALALGDSDLTTAVNRAIALEGLGRRLDAAAAWRAVAAREGETALGRRARDKAAALAR